MSLKSHALHHISIITVLSCILDVCNWLFAGRIGLGWTYDAISFAYHMFMHSPCICTLFSIYLLYLNCFGTFLIVSLSLTLFLFTLVVSIAPKRKSPPSQNPLHSRALSSSDLTPSPIRFCDEDPWKDFSENFSRQGVHLERRVILADFANTDFPTVIHSQGWKSLCDVPVTSPTVLIQEFYSNMHGFNFSVPLFSTRVWGMRIVVTSQFVADALHVLRVEHPDYLGC